MEGLTGVSAREEVTKGEPEYAAAQAQMTAETAAAIRGAWEGGARDIWVKDAHWTGRNIEPAGLPDLDGGTVRLVRGWSGHPFSMVQGLDASFQAVGFLGYHSAAARGGNPLAHTLSSRLLARVLLNGELTSEFRLYGYAAASVGVPVIFLAGDAALCDEARTLAEGITTVSTIEGFGASIVSRLPGETLREIERAMTTAMRGASGMAPMKLPSSFDLRVTFHNPNEAYRRSFFPGCRLEDDTDVIFSTKEYFEILRALKFMTLS